MKHKIYVALIVLGIALNAFAFSSLTTRNDAEILHSFGVLMIVAGSVSIARE